jgi:phosphatidate cytidylyltransferase
MTYGRPDDARRPARGRDRYEPDQESYSARPHSEPEPDWRRRYGEVPPASPNGYPPPASAYAPPATYRPPASYPGGSPYSSADTYPAAAPDSYAPDAFTSFRAAPAPASPTFEPEPVYVASGLYLDDQVVDDDSRLAAFGAEPDRDGWHTAAATSHSARDEPERPTQRGGRNLPAAIGVGLGLGAVVLASLFVWRPAFLGVVAVAIGVAIWELVRAMRTTGVEPPLVPLIAGGVLTTGLAWWGGGDGLTFGLIITIVAVMVWRFAHGVHGYGRDVTMAALIAVYVPFLGGFAAMLASAHDGQLRVLATLIAVVLSDTGGYVVGAKFGRHPMAPSVSPKKSWEGLVGSLLAAALGSAAVLFLMFHVSLWWGLLFGLSIAGASVVGDLGESMLKRDMGVKDMSGLLPGHGGLMDRLDSVVFAAPVGFLLLAAIAPVTS